MYSLRSMWSQKRSQSLWTVFEKAEKLINKEKLQSFFPAADLKDVLMAHELFHGFEYERKRKQIFTQTEKIELWGHARFPINQKSYVHVRWQQWRLQSV